MIHLGDITKIKGDNIPQVDVITFGSPCQDLSIAGKRTGLSGERSGLFMEAVRIIKEMREATNEEYPKYAVWENVPGAFSSNKGEDFRAVLEELARIKEADVSIPRPDNSKWAKAGLITGDDWSIAWRTMDAQYWGVPQRRLRISLVLDFTGGCAGKILFEPESLRGHFAPGITPGQATAGTVENGAGTADRAFTLKIRSGCEGGGKGALVQTEKRATLSTLQDQTLFVAEPPKAYSFDSLSSNSMKSKNPHSGCREVDVAKTLDTTDPTPSKNQGGIAVVAPAVALDMTHACDVIRECGEQVPALQARMGTGGNQVPLTYGIGNGQANEASIMAEEVSQTLNTMHDAQAVMCDDVGHALRAKANCAYREDAETYVAQNMVVRRLTPLECTRLQGYPDGWVDIGDWTDEKGKKHKDADSPKYKALGNSIALPFWDWMMRRMARYLPEGATLGSLFDGIGGFPLIWERIHGKGTARWASEIEPFPIAVTKKWFGEE